MAYVKIIYQNSPSTATPINAENLNHMDDQIALNDQRLTEIETSYVKSFNGRKGEVVPEDGDYDIGQIAPLTGAQVGQVPVVTNIGTEEDPELVFRMGAGGGAGGHEIIDSEGNTMPQESAMQFPDSFVSDDDVNGRTVVENVKEVTLAELSQATERGMYLATDEESVPIGEIGVDYEEVEADGTKTLGTLLNELYAEIDLSKITEHAVLFRGDDAYYMQLSRITSDNHLLFGSVLGQSSALLEYEAEMFTSGSRIQYAKVQSSGNTITPITNNQPANHTKLRFYYGTSSTVINLKTSADYCMMSDGVTSVEQRLAKYIVNSTWESGVTLESTSYLLRDGDFVYIQLSGTVGSSMTAYAEKLIGHVDSSQIPNVLTVIPLIWNNNVLGYMVIRTDGSISVAGFDAISSNTIFYANGVYRIA